MIVPALALTAALLSACATIFIRLGLRRGDPYTGVWINMIVGAAQMWMIVLVTGAVGPFSRRSLLLFASAGIIGTIGGRLMRFLAVEKVGASVSAAVGNLTPLIATLLAIAVLGERVTAAILVGTIVIVVGTVLLSTSGGRVGFRPWQIGLPLLSATCFGTVAVIRKIALGEMGPVLGAAVNFTTAFIAFTAVMIASGHRGLYACRGRTLVYFVAAGIAENTGVFLVLMALTVGSVSVVLPLASSVPIFVLVLSAIFLRNIEVVTGRVVVGTLLIVAGVCLITALAGR